MKKGLLFAVISVGLNVLQMSAQNDTELKNTTNKVWQVSASGYGIVTADVELRPNRGEGVDFNWESLVNFFTVTSPDSRFLSVTAVDARYVSEGGDKWLIEANAGLNIDKTSFVVGRIPLGVPNYTKERGNLQTVHSPHVPWDTYGNGARLEISPRTNIMVSASLGIGTRQSGSSHENWGSVVGSTRVQVRTHDWLTFGSTIQISDEFIRGGSDFKYLPKTIPELSFCGEIYDNLTQNGNSYGGYLLGSYRLTPHLSPHLQFDFLGGHGDKSDAIIAAGFSYRLNRKSDRMKLIVDWEQHLEKTGKTGLYGGFTLKY